MSKTMKGLHVGLVVGGVIGFVIGLAVMIEGYSTMENLEFIGWVFGLIFGLLFTGPIGLVIGALIGAFVGWVQGRNSSSREGVVPRQSEALRALRFTSNGQPQDLQVLGSGLEVGREKANMGGGRERVIVGIVLTCGGIGAMSLGWLMGGIEVVVAAGWLMETSGVVLCLYSAIESLKQEKKGGVPKVRSSNEWVCRNCGSQNKQGLDKCIWCGADLK
jgi:hypothetical protein